MLREIDFIVINHLSESHLKKNAHKYEIWNSHACLNSPKFMEMDEG